MGNWGFGTFVLIAALAVIFSAVPRCVQGADSLLPMRLEIDVGDEDGPREVSRTVQLLLLLTVLSLAPAILVMVTSFTRIVIVLSFLKRALATGSQPSQKILIGLALFLTFFIMGNVWTEISEKAYTPYINGELTQTEAFAEGVQPIRSFMFKQTREKDLALFVYLSRMDKPRNLDGIPTSILIPAFIISELKTAFTMGFILYLPFLVIDMVVASVLLSMGMMMLPPVMISLPFKVLLFVMVDGWYLVVRSLALSF
jgi:flagellar biosynthetic protein FliP